jgi:hypothetical protein
MFGGQFKVTQSKTRQHAKTNVLFINHHRCMLHINPKKKQKLFVSGLYYPTSNFLEFLQQHSVKGFGSILTLFFHLLFAIIIMIISIVFEKG